MGGAWGGAIARRLYFLAGSNQRMMSSSESPLPSSSVSMRVVDVSGELEDLNHSSILTYQGLQFSGQSLAKVSQLSRYTSAAKHNVAAIIADGNNLMTLQGIQHYPALIQVRLTITH